MVEAAADVEDVLTLVAVELASLVVTIPDASTADAVVVVNFGAFERIVAVPMVVVPKTDDMNAYAA